MRRHLIQFALILSLPLIALVAFIFWKFVLNERRMMETQATDAAQALTIAIDREIFGLQNAAEILSYDVFLKTGQLAPFQTSIHDVGRELKVVITLYDPKGRPLITSQQLDPQALPMLPQAVLEQSAQHNKPYITGISKIELPPDQQAGRITDRRGELQSGYSFSVVYPVHIDGRIIYYLSLSKNAQRIQDILSESSYPQQWLIGVVDQNDYLVARNHDSAHFIGRLASADLRNNTPNMQGRWDNAVLDGDSAMGTYIRSYLSGWRVAVGVRYSELNRPVWMSFFSLIGLALGAILMSIVLASYYGRKISRPVFQLASQALAIGRDKPIEPLQSDIHELNIVSNALILADERRRKKEVVLLEAQLRLQMALDAGRIGIWEYSEQTGELTLDRRSSEMMVFQGKRIATFDPDFLSEVHPDDRKKVRDAMQKALKNGDIVRETFRVCDVETGNCQWINGIGRRIYDDDGNPTILGLVVNVTAEQRALEEREVVSQELNHRLKNMFAVIISLISVTARGKTDIQDYVSTLRERMTALSGAFELAYQKGTVSGDQSVSVSLNELLRRLAQPYMFDETGRITISGDELPCLIASITPMSLVFHEMVTNSIKHGALSVRQGQVHIHLSKQDEMILIEWQEAGGPAIMRPPEQKGFGSRLKQLSIETQMHGSFQEIWDRNGLICRIRLPLPEI